ncbi:hypothetical protein KP509_16G005200 [Ceratopteris richardii]|uniref:Uncharacterized protein n=1 Tax=Ceratopteris richardii TaxID=49495 RepID=A0A8T2T1V0_CERRI|nr:hypothetical protein KP509_16G005200 [Ceratopteris richardii]
MPMMPFCRMLSDNEEPFLVSSRNTTHIDFLAKDGTIISAFLATRPDSERCNVANTTCLADFTHREDDPQLDANCTCEDSLPVAYEGNSSCGHALTDSAIISDFLVYLSVPDFVNVAALPTMEFRTVTFPSAIDHFEVEVPASDAEVLAYEAPNLMDEILANDSEVPAGTDESVVFTANAVTPILMSPILTADNGHIIEAFLTGLVDGQQQPVLLITSSAEAPLLETSLDDLYSEDEKIIAAFLDSTHPSYGNITSYSWLQDHTVSLADAQKTTSTPISLANIPDRSIFPNGQTHIVQLCMHTSLSCFAPAQAAIIGTYGTSICSLVYKPNIFTVDACTSNIRVNFPSTRWQITFHPPRQTIKFSLLFLV